MSKFTQFKSISCHFLLQSCLNPSKSINIQLMIPEMPPKSMIIFEYCFCKLHHIRLINLNYSIWNNNKIIMHLCCLFRVTFKWRYGPFFITLSVILCFFDCFSTVSQSLVIDGYFQTIISMQCILVVERIKPKNERINVGELKSTHQHV